MNHPRQARRTLFVVALCCSILVVLPPLRADGFSFSVYKVHRAESLETHPGTESFEIPVPAGSLETLFDQYICARTSYMNALPGDARMKIFAQAQVLTADGAGETNVANSVKLKGKAVEGRELWRQCKRIKIEPEDDAIIRVDFSFVNAPELDYPFAWYEVGASVGSQNAVFVDDNRRGTPQWTTSVRFSGRGLDRHQRTFEGELLVPEDIPEGGELCVRYTSDDPGGGKVKTRWSVLRGRNDKVIGRGKLPTARVLEERTRIFCGQTNALRAADQVRLHYRFAGMPETSGWAVQASLSPVRETESYVELDQADPPPGSVIGPRQTVDTQSRGHCDDNDGCSVEVHFGDEYGELMWGGGGRIVPRGDFVLNRSLSGCGEGETAAGLLLEVRRRNGVLLAERFVPGEYTCSD